MTEYVIGNWSTGRRILSLPVMTGPWSDLLHRPEEVTVTVDMNDPDVQALGLRNSATPGQAFLGVEENGVVMAAGPIWTRKYSRTNRTLTLGALGAGSYFDHRLILPLLAKTLGVDQWTVPDPADATKTIPNPLLSTVYNGISLGTMAKRLVQQSRLWTGGMVPIVFQADEADDRTKTWYGADFKPIWEAITDIMNLDGGPEVNFLPRRTSDGQGYEWLLQTGTVAQPLITSNSILLWDVTVAESPVSDLSINEDASKMGSLAWQMGGNQSDDVLVARAYDEALIDANYPLLELFDGSHSSVSVQSTLDDYAIAQLLSGQTSVEVWPLTVKAYPTDEDGNPAGPQVGQFAVGDFADIVLCPWNPDTGEGDPYLVEGGTFRMRLIGISGDERGEDLKLDFAPIVRD